MIVLDPLSNALSFHPRRHLDSHGGLLVLISSMVETANRRVCKYSSCHSPLLPNILPGDFRIAGPGISHMLRPSNDLTSHLTPINASIELLVHQATDGDVVTTNEVKAMTDFRTRF